MSPPYSVVGAFLGEQVGSFVIIAHGILSSDCQNAILNTRSRRHGKRATALNKGSASANQDEGHDSHHLESHAIRKENVNFHGVTSLFCFEEPSVLQYRWLLCHYSTMVLASQIRREQLYCISKTLIMIRFYQKCRFSFLGGSDGYFPLAKWQKQNAKEVRHEREENSGVGYGSLF